MRVEAEPWWRQAEADLATARDVMAGGHYYAVSWFAQQAVEKALKALYIDLQAVMPPRTHDLLLLGRLVGTPLSIAPELGTLNAVFDLVRYPHVTSGPAPVDQITGAQASGHFAAAEGVMAWVARQIMP